MKAQMLTLALTALLGFQAQAQNPLRCQIMKENPNRPGFIDQSLWIGQVTPVQDSQFNLFLLQDGRVLSTEQLTEEVARLAKEGHAQASQLLKGSKMFSIGGVKSPKGYISLMIHDIGKGTETRPDAVYAVAKADYAHLTDSRRGVSLACEDAAK